MKVYELMNMLSGMEAGREVKLNFEVKTSRLVRIATDAEGAYAVVEYGSETELRGGSIPTL